MLRVGYFQFRPVFGAVEKNRATVLAALARARADLIVLPELPFTGYAFKNRLELSELAEDPRRSPTLNALTELCRARSLYVATGFAERHGKRLYNSAFLVGPRGVVQHYRKLHLFFREKLYFDEGNLPLGVSSVRGAKVGLMVCFDYMFPEVARRLALLGADLLAHPSNLVTHYGQGVMATRALENGVFAITANRIGEDRRPGGKVRFTGMSQIVDPRGELIAKAAGGKPALTIVRIEPTVARDKYFTPMNHLLHDRRPAFYQSR